MRSRTSTLLAALALLWLVLILVLYYSGHKPGEPEQLLALGTAAWRILVAVSLTMLAGGLGARIYQRDSEFGLTRLAIQAGLGFGLLGTGALIVGMTLGLPGWLPWAALVVLGMVLRRSIAAWLRGWRGLVELWRESGPFERTLVGLIGMIFLATLVLALAPPIRFDSLVYHLALPNAYLHDGRVSYYPWIVMSGMPQIAELLYTWAIALGGNEAAAVLGWMFGLLAIVGLLGSLRQAFDPRAAWVGASAILAGFTPAILLSSGYVDWLVFLLALGALNLFAAWRQDGTRTSLLWAGVLTGMAIGSKYTSGVLALAGLVVLAVHLRRPLDFLKNALVYGLAASFTALPWFLKNILTTGNPFYPFFLNGGAMSAVRAQVYQSGPTYGNWLDIFFLPVRATYLGFDAGEGYMFAPGMLLLGLGALAWLSWSGSDRQAEPQAHSEKLLQRAPLFSTAAVLALAGLAVWAVGNQLSGNLIQTRYYFSIFPAFAVLAAAGDVGLRRLRLGTVRMGRIGAALILMALAFNGIETGLKALKNDAPGRPWD